MNRLSREQVEQWLATAPPKASVYLVGAGGCGMSGLAHLLLDLDLAVQGSDLRDHAGLRLLRERGAVLHEGHAPEQLRAAQPDLVVYSSAIRMDNPELALAQQLGIPLVRRAVLLAALAHQRRARRRRGVGRHAPLPRGGRRQGGGCAVQGRGRLAAPRARRARVNAARLQYST